MAITAMLVFVVSSSCGGDDDEAVFSAISGLNGKWELTSIDKCAVSGDSIIKGHHIINKEDNYYLVFEFKSSGNLIIFNFDEGRVISNDTVQYHVENGCIVLIDDGVEKNRWPFRMKSNSLSLIIEKYTLFGIETWTEYVFKRMK